MAEKKRTASVVLQEGSTYKLDDGTIFVQGKAETIEGESQIARFRANSRFTVTINEEKPDAEPEGDAPESKDSKGQTAPVSSGRGRPKKGKN